MNTLKLWASWMCCLLGVLSLPAVLCFYFPDILTSLTFRQSYTENFARNLLTAGMLLCAFSGTFSVLLGARHLPLLGLSSCLLSLSLSYLRRA